jgi:hypothetical protein
MLHIFTNAMICCTFTTSVMVMPLLLLKNTVNGFLCTEFRITKCLTKRSVHCVNVVRFPVLMFHLNEYVNKMCRDTKAFMKWYSLALLLAHENFLCTYMSPCSMNTFMTMPCTHFTHSACKIYTQATVQCV